MPESLESQRKYIWYIEPRGNAAHANKAINDYLHDADERAMESIRDTDGKPHPVWECTYDQANLLFQSSETLQAHFSIWNRPNRNVGIHYVTFLMPLGKNAKPDKRRLFIPGPPPVKEETLITQETLPF